MEKKEQHKLNTLFEEHNFKDYKWIMANEMKVSQWVRMKCMFGCDEFGNASCPPNVPSVEDCKAFFNEYEYIVIFHFEKIVKKDDYPKDWAQDVYNKLLELEKAVFLSGYYKAFLLSLCSCSFCGDCMKTRIDCNKPLLGRPTPEALAVDVFATVRPQGFPINVLNEKETKMNRYAFLLVK